MKALLGLLILPFSALAGSQHLTGNLRWDLISVSPADSFPKSETVMVRATENGAGLKHPLLGGALSLLVPGAGEFYSERYVKSGIFFALEVAAVTAAIVYNSKGDTKTTEFQEYADKHWSAVDYVLWILKNGAKYQTSGTSYPTIPVKSDASLPPWQRINYDSLNRWEAAPHSVGFSHTLPPHGDQQYYELIGKYSQFKYGWDTYQYNGAHDGDDGYDVNFIPQQMKDYAANRGTANDYYYFSEVAVALVVANHILSALDGVWSTGNYNREVSSEMGMRLQEIGGGQMTLVAQLNVRVNM